MASLRCLAVGRWRRSPPCCPSRSSIFTGRYPHNTGIFTNGGDDGGFATFKKRGEEQSTFATSLQQAGYRTAMMGKYLNAYNPDHDPPAPGWSDWDVAGLGYTEFNYDLNQNGTVHKYGHAAKDYLTDVISSKAQSFIGNAAASGTITNGNYSIYQFMLSFRYSFN